WVSCAVNKAASLGDRLSQREPPDSEGDLRLGTKRPERQERLRFAVEVYRVIRMDEDVVSGLIKKRTKGRERSSSAPFQHHPLILPRRCGPPRPGNCIEDSLRRQQCRNARWSCHVTQHADQRCSLIRQRHNHLRLDGTVFDRINNGLLEFDLRTTFCANSAPVWNRNVAIDVHSLTRNANKITGAN